MSEQVEIRQEEFEPSPDERQRMREALGATPGICCALDPSRTFMCWLDAGHGEDHDGFELPTVTFDEPFCATPAADR